MTATLVAAGVLSPLVQGDGALTSWQTERDINVASAQWDEYEAVNLYTANASRELSPWDINQLAAFCGKNLAGRIRPLYRGIQGATSEILEALKVGSVHDNGFMSTSACPGIAKRFADTPNGGGVILRFHTDQGAAVGDWLSVKGDEEREVLIGPAVSFRVVAVSEEIFAAGWDETVVTVVDCEIL